MEIKDRKSWVMVEERTLTEYSWPQFTRGKFSVQVPAVTANNFEIKVNIIGMIQISVKFDGLTDGDPNANLLRFL